MEDILSIQSGVEFDESISHYETHAHQPYTSLNFSNNDEIRIAIQHQDLNLLPSRSSIHIQGRITDDKGAPAADVSLVNNGMSFLFEEIRYELNGMEVDKCKNVGLTSIMKGFPSMNPNHQAIIENAGWHGLAAPSQIANQEGFFDINIPLRMVLGFAEDYTKIIVNIKHELILTRSRSDLNAVISNNKDAKFIIELKKIEWIMPYVHLSDKQKIHLLKRVEKNSAIAVPFRSWDLYENPFLPASKQHVWTVKTTNQMEKPRYLILGFQTKRKLDIKRNAGEFDHCNITNVKLFLNSQYYPYGNLDIDFKQNRYAALYDMFTNFQSSYYNKNPAPMVTKNQYRDHLPLIIIDCSKQNEILKTGSVDVRLEFDASENFPTGTSAYALIIHDRIIEYKPMSGDVRKVN